MKTDKKAALAEFHREQMLTAAEKLFEAKGVAGTTMDDIAKAADYSKATIYVYFKNKDEIVNALVLRGMRLLHTTISEAIRKPQNWIKTYYSICNAIAGFYSENPAAYEATTGNINVDLDAPETPQVFRDIFEVGEQINRSIATFFEQGIADGVLKKQVCVMQTVFTFWASLTGIMRMAKDKQDYISRYLGIEKEHFLQNSYQLLLDSILTGGQTE
ncbi:TetR/AcrR family transcriptional regulator [Oscillospiraceae bacterium PP1C4]